MKTCFGPEPLETRVAPAGLINVSVAGGVLKLVGDSSDNAVAVNVLFNGMVELAPSGGTSLLFEGSTTTNTLSVPVSAPKLVANLGAGTDSLTLTGNYGSLAIDLGAGNDFLLFNSLVVGGSTKIVGGQGNENVIGISPMSQRFLGKVSFDLGSGNDSVVFNGFEAFFGGSVSFLGGTGIDTFGASSFATFGGNLLLSLGAGSGLVSMNGSFVKVVGKTTISSTNTPSETMLAEIKPTNLTMEGGLAFSGGTGTNTLQLQPTNSAQINAGIQYHSGGAANFVLQTSMVSVGGNVVAKSTGPMAFSLVGPQLLSVEGRVSAVSSAGNTSFFLVGFGAVAGGISVTGKLGGSVNLGSPLQIGKTATFNFAQATSSVSLSISSTTFFGSVLIATGSANDSISLNDGTITGKLTVLAGGENDTIGLENTGVGTLTVAGPVLVNAGSGNDSVTAGNTIMFGKLNAFSPVILIGGSGSDSLFLTANNNILLAGSTATGFEIGS